MKQNLKCELQSIPKHSLIIICSAVTGMPSLQDVYCFKARWERSAPSWFTDPDFTKFMPGVNERVCGFPCVSTLAPVFAVSESLIAVTLRDRQACAETMASKSQRLTATDSHLPPKHTSGPLRSLSLPPLSLSFLSLSGEIEETQR